MATPSSDPMVGRTIAQYDILARVGGGGMGVVYQARDRRLGRLVALKFLPQQWSHDENARQRFMREAQAASATSHPNICTIHDIETADDGQLFIVMAFYDGQTLKERLAQGPLPADEALEIATQIADGLARAHAQGVVHRDVKPGNVIVTEDGVRIVDFGLATFADAVKLTVENTTLGTVAYMSPEQVRGQAADARSDVWAVGAILYEMLAGHPPFQGAYAEAVSYAIRNEAPVPLRDVRPEVSEEVEQLVFRALHKEPAVRYPSGRELARALRQVRGQSMPLDLRTGPVPSPAYPPATPRPLPQPAARRRRRAATASAAVALIALAGAGALAFVPAGRTAIAVVPVVNQTGYAELDPLRLGLSEAIGSALADARAVRVVSHDQLSAILRGVQERGSDVSSGEAIQAIKASTGATALVVVTLLNPNDGSGFRARVEFRDADTLVNDGAPYETPPEVSALVKDAAYRLVPAVVSEIDAHFDARRPLRARLGSRLRQLMRLDAALVPPVAGPDAAAAWERGVAAYEAVELVDAARALADAAEQDRLSPLLFAWRSRVARAMRRDADGEQFARQAVALLTAATPERVRWLVEATDAEARGDADRAADRYAALSRRRPDDAGSWLELGAFQDRQGRNPEAIASYHRALALDPTLLRPHLELCRLYNRVNQPVDARDHGRRALDGYRAIGWDGGQAQALFCLTDSLRVGNDRERIQAVSNATAALEIVERGGFAYNLPRAQNYLALAEEAQGRLAPAARLWEQALASARDAGNEVIQPLVLMNLGATNDKLGRRAQAIEFTRESARGFEALGDQARAAENLFNLGAMLVAYGRGEEGTRSVRDALGVFRKLGNRSFEVRSAHVMSTYYLYSGRLADAERELNRAVSLAAERDLDFRAVTAVRFAELRLDQGDYGTARTLLQDALPRAPARTQVEGRLYLAAALTRLGDREGAAAILGPLGEDREAVAGAGLQPLLYRQLGEHALESGLDEDARRYFAQGAALLSVDLPDVDALASQAWHGLLEARAGRVDAGRRAIATALDVARRIGHRSIAARCRLFLAQIEIAAGRTDAARAELAQVPADDEAQAIERELRAQWWHWKARAEAGDDAASDHNAARAAVMAMAAPLTPADRARFLVRPAIATMLAE